jgi:hypothetical protein
MTYHGHIENGMVVLDSHCPLPDGTSVTVTAAAKSCGDGPESTHVKLALEISTAVPNEVWDTLPRDGASNVDHYLYGAPKRAK